MLSRKRNKCQASYVTVCLRFVGSLTFEQLKEEASVKYEDRSVENS